MLSSLSSAAQDGPNARWPFVLVYQLAAAIACSALLCGESRWPNVLPDLYRACHVPLPLEVATSAAEARADVHQQHLQHQQQLMADPCAAHRATVLMAVLSALPGYNTMHLSQLSV